MKRSKNLCGIWEDCFLFLNPINNYVSFKEGFDFPVISHIIVTIAALWGSIKSIIAICFFAPFMAINMLLKP